ncbi:helix-turn-helix domain-containing protein [Oceanicaulis sp. MMSF_3324]|uniref:helix-turn-helix domain-containing protein n=1 Tax=Oceanicaulis sp. MMSF_3324 TaxID=3046702 RepID=UPI00273D649D|nr:helix-turn-helix domain-containing protein [Oceanicaulis sp. MMSF_3324]
MRTNTLALDQARARLAQQAAAYAFGVPVEEINAPTRGRARAALARQAAIYLTHVAFELSLNRVADAFGRDRSTAAHACHRIEDARDDPAFDAAMEDLEACLRSAPGPDLIPFRMTQ